MGLKPMSDQEIANAVYHIQELDDICDADSSDYLQLETEIQCLEQHTGMALYKLLDDCYV